MASKFEIRPKGRITLVGIEIVVFSIIAALWLKNKYSWDNFSAFIAGVITGIILGGLFFGFRLFRYFFSIIFSLFWGYLAFQLAESMTDSTVARWVTFGLVVILSLSIHRDYFRFER